MVSRPTPRRGAPAEANPGNSHQSSSDPGLVRIRPALGHRFAYDTVRSEQHGGFKLPFSWDEGDGTGEPGAQRRARHLPAWSKTIKALLERLLDIPRLALVVRRTKGTATRPKRTQGTATNPRLIQVWTDKVWWLSPEFALARPGSPRASKQGCRFRFFDASGLVPPPSLWTDASGFSVDASGLVPPIRFGQGEGDGGTS